MPLTLRTSSFATKSNVSYYNIIVIIILVVIVIIIMIIIGINIAILQVVIQKTSSVPLNI